MTDGDTVEQLAREIHSSAEWRILWSAWESSPEWLREMQLHRARAILNGPTVRKLQAEAWDKGYWQGINGHTGPGNPYAEPNAAPQAANQATSEAGGE